jgi:hypothetical protein
MTREEFIRLCQLCGYSSKRNAVKYAEGREEFTDRDFIEVHRMNERQNDLKHGILRQKCKADSDGLINNLNHKPKPWCHRVDASRGRSRYYDNELN